jgi:hypothetical protein
MVVRGSCISERMPSCMRAPPEAANSTHGVPRATAVSMPVMIASPAAMPSEPPMKPKSCTTTVVSSPSTGPTPTRTASCMPVLARASLRRSV